MSESIFHIREKLGQIDALVGIPPGSASAGMDAGVISHTIHRPRDASTLLEPETDGAYSQQELDEMDPEEADLEPVFEWGPESAEKMQALSAAAGNQIRNSVKVENGSDALGHYASFHVTGRQWGATVNLSGIAWLMTEVFGDIPVDTSTKSRLAFHAILQHELFHFATDIAVAQAEMSQQKAWWALANLGRLARGDGYLRVEEKLANAWMLRAFRTALPGFRVRGKQEALKRFVAMQPDGYRNGSEIKSARDWTEGLHEIAWYYAEDSGREGDNPLLWGHGYDWSSQFPLRPRIDWRECAIHLIDDSARYGIPPGWLTFFSALPNVGETEDFRKQLRRLPQKIQTAWVRTKARVRDGLTRGDDFKQWKPGGPEIWSIRLNSGYRAHLRHTQATGTWTATKIGGHKEMGHG